MVAILTSIPGAGKQMQHPRRLQYSANGVAASRGGIPAGDTNAAPGDGGVVATPDIPQIIGGVALLGLSSGTAVVLDFLKQTFFR